MKKVCVLMMCILVWGCSEDPEPMPTKDMPADLVTDMVVDLSEDAKPDIQDMQDLFDMKDAPDDIADMMPDFVEMSPPSGFGALMGSCGVLDTELSDAQGTFIENSIDFADDPYDMADLMRLTMGGQEIIKDGNAGGSSVLSEVFAFEVLQRCEQATLLKTETEITYKMQGKITDLLVEIDGVKIGVSVTRAVKFPRDDQTMFPLSRAQSLLEDKLDDILKSSNNVSDEDKWAKQILHVLAYDEQHAAVLKQAYADLDAQFKADTIVWVTVTNGMDEFIY